MLALLLSLALVAATATLLVHCVRKLRAIPDARAWDPHSHDKIVAHAIDLLADGPRGNPLTLIGWVLQEARLAEETTRRRFFWTNSASQLRRGAVEEDMNSSIISHILYDWLPGHLDSLEGSNGGYHFCLPDGGDGQGLTDLTYLPHIFGEIGSGCASPMPSAYERATLLPNSGKDPGGKSQAPFQTLHLALRAAGVGQFFVARVLVGLDVIGSAYYYLAATHYSEWHMDEEGRNYSFTDADQYWDNGYSHLAYYSLGRIAHLLSDMAVPAHVRNDSHAGTAMQIFGCDPSDPVEIYAEKEDARIVQSNEAMVSALVDSDGKHLYAYNPRRTYPREGLVYEAAKGRWPEVSSANRGETDRLFHRLASLLF